MPSPWEAIGPEARSIVHDDAALRAAGFTPLPPDADPRPLPRAWVMAAKPRDCTCSPNRMEGRPSCPVHKGRSEFTPIMPAPLPSNIRPGG